MASSAGGGYMAYSPSPSSATAPHSPQIHGVRPSSVVLSEQEKYLNELMAERHKISPFTAILPICYRLISQKTLRVTAQLESASVLGQSVLEHASHLTSGGIISIGGADFNGWPSKFQSERPSMQQPQLQNWLSTPGSSSGFVMKKTIRLDIPVDQYPNYNFVGCILGPRGNSLKRVEASTECRVLIRGRGSIKDPARLYNFVFLNNHEQSSFLLKEEMMRGKLGFEHLNEPLHILIEAELLVEIVDARLMQAHDVLQNLLDPVDESQDFLQKAAVARAGHD